MPRPVHGAAVAAGAIWDRSMSDAVQILLGTLQQVATVTISSVVNLLIVGVLLVAFVIIAPKGIVGLVQDWRRGRSQP